MQSIDCRKVSTTLIQITKFYLYVKWKRINKKQCQNNHLDESDFLGVAAETLPAAHEPILPNQTMRVSTDSAVRNTGTRPMSTHGNEEEKKKKAQNKGKKIGKWLPEPGSKTVVLGVRVPNVCVTHRRSAKLTAKYKP